MNLNCLFWNKSRKTKWMHGFYVLLIIILSNPNSLICNEEYALDSVPTLYYGKVEKANSFFIQKIYKNIDGEAKLVNDTIIADETSDIREFEYYLYNSKDYKSFIIIKYMDNPTYFKYYLKSLYIPEYPGLDYKANLYYHNCSINVNDIGNDILQLTIRKFSYREWNSIAYNRSTARKILESNESIESFLNLLSNNYYSAQPMDQYPGYWLSIEYANPWQSQFRIQGLATNITDFGTNDNILLNLSIPSFSFAKNDKGTYMFPVSLGFMSVLGGLHLLSEVIAHLIYTKEELEKQDNTFFLQGGLFFAGLISIFNFGIDVPITTGTNYSAFTFKLNSEAFFYEVKDSALVGYFEPKIGFKYLYKSTIGIGLNAGYRFWNHPTPVVEKHPYFSMELLYPIKFRKY